MNNNYTILIDMDDVIENFCEEWCNILSETYNLSIKYSDITEWKIDKFFPTLTHEQIMLPIYSNEIWEKVKPIDGAVKYIKQLIEDGFNVYICTATYYKNIQIKFEKIIQKYFPFIDWEHIIIAYNKQMIKADFLIDDGLHNLVGGEYKKILFNAPHNQCIDISNDIVRMYNWEEIYKYIINYIKIKEKSI